MKIYLFSIGIIAFILIGCLGEDPILPLESSADIVSSMEESSEESLSSDEAPEKSITLDDIKGEWFFSKVMGGGPNDFLVAIEDDESITFTLTLLGTVKNSAEGTIEVKDDSILLKWDECKAKKEVVECDDDSASKIPNELGFDGSAIYDADNTDYIYEKK
ncbi:MAG: hypothetical protein OCC49_11260 [Fibrobacterales bacterium]